MKLLLATVAAAVCCGPAAATPRPDPDPSAQHGIRWVAYQVWVPALDRATGLVIPGLRFHLFVSAVGLRRWTLEASAAQAGAFGTR